VERLYYVRDVSSSISGTPTLAFPVLSCPPRHHPPSASAGQPCHGLPYAKARYAACSILIFHPHPSTFSPLQPYIASVSWRPVFGLLGQVAGSSGSFGGHRDSHVPACQLSPGRSAHAPSQPRLKRSGREPSESRHVPISLIQLDLIHLPIRRICQHAVRRAEGKVWVLVECPDQSVGAYQWCLLSG
jgi:hypothetical protein